MLRKEPKYHAPLHYNIQSRDVAGDDANFDCIIYNVLLITKSKLVT